MSDALPGPLNADCQITQSTWNLRSEMKTQARPFVQATYGFKNSNNPDVIAQNVARAAALLEGSAFTYLVCTILLLTFNVY